MKPWTKLTNDELCLHLELWLEVDGRVESEHQKEFFNEVMWRLRMVNHRLVFGNYEGDGGQGV